MSEENNSTIDHADIHFIDNLEAKSHGKISDEMLEKIPDKVWEVIEDPNTIRVIVTPEKRTSLESKYSLQSTDLPPNQKMVVLLDPNQKGILKDIILGHHKRSKYWNCGTGSPTDWDSAGAYTTIRVFDGSSNTWKEWRDPSGYSAKKYAERRGDIEYEILHDWLKTVGVIEPQAIEITSTGEDSEWSVVTEESLDVINHPETSENTEIMENIYTPSTSFVDLVGKTKLLPTYGGGEHRGYIKALPLCRKHGNELFEMSEEPTTDMEKFENGTLRIILPPNKKILSLEVAIGDTWHNYGGNGGRVLGWSKFNAKLKSKNGVDQFMTNVNIPPQGVLSGGISDSEYITQEGDEIVLSATNTSYLMGWRVLMENAKNKTEEILESVRGQIG
ncbi:MAG: hypothetical protein V1679_02800 [Candidatus Peregrinibacteria bacterium]